ncbi:sigma-70 family RNA polymerase sigma factor [Streptomyces pseudovenezuelae]|uniref:sigma-70 family RNA polymerase sigma factor n=1 Tax=Streptomyces pseudovenezuelae TaxID=67350 RepID=UPI002E351AB4|nr:sigma-70 family RNA polymerase sigma factor [Streptomyces pseudovenezuelae]
MTDQPARVPALTSPSATAEAAAAAAYVRIYEQEQPRLVAYARSLTRNTWAAEDLVAEAHFRVWRRLSAGHEIDNVPAYLMTTVRHLASSVASSATHETPRDPQLPQVPEQASAGQMADPAEQVSATDLLVRVLGELPERWVRALWLADAEGQPLETVGRQIGAKQGATAVLLHRAREGMRQAFLRSQTEAPEDPACEVHWVRMPAYVRGNATPRQSERLLAHVDACDGCRGRLAVLIRANHRLPALVGPALLVLAVGGGGKFLASLTAGSAGAGGAAGAAGAASATGQGLLRTARAAGPKTKAALASGTTVAAAVAVVLALGLNESPATVTSPGRAPVAQGPVSQEPVAGPSAGAAGRTPGNALPVEAERGRDRDRGDGAGAVVIWGAGGAGGFGSTGDSGDSEDSGDGSSGSEGGGVVGEPGTPEPPADPTPVPPEKQKPEPGKPKPGGPGEKTPVPEPSTPTPADPPPVDETPDPPTYSEPPTAPGSPQPSDPPAASQPPTTPVAPPSDGDGDGDGDGCGPGPAPGTSATDKGVEPGEGTADVLPAGQAFGAA